MCGIAGVVNFSGEPASVAVLKRMTDAIAHRGPDGEGHYTDGALGLGHRRLAIIDLSPAGRQPMATRDGRYVVSYNGEIYNFRELRVELEALGHGFVSRSDTEVLLAAWSQWGTKALDRFNGMFAFALWDKRERTLTLARDRYGIKPLYYARAGGAFLFGSEVKAILAHGAYRTQVDKAALLEYFTFQNFFTERTLFEGVRLLPAGCHMTIGEGGRAGDPVCYWDYNFVEPDRPRDEAEYVEELDRLFCQAVKRQLVSDVDVGSYLSGGMDSGSITAIASSSIPNLRTFTCGFDLHSASGMEMAFDERAAAEHMSYLFKTEQYEVVLKAGDMERAMPRLALHMEEPRVGQSYPNFYVAQLASKFVKVTLAGTGGDELFGGYPWRYYRAVVNDGFENYIDKYYQFWQRLVPNSSIKPLFAPVWGDVKNVWTRDIFRDVFKDHPVAPKNPVDYVNHSLYFEAKTFLNGLLVVEDKLSMAHGMEVRVPFLDNDLVDFAMRLPVSMKIGNLDKVVRINENDIGDKAQIYYQRTRDGKLLLRKAMARHIPPAVRDAPKQGFSAPDESWFKGESMEYVKKVLLGKQARQFEFLDRDTVQKLVDEHLSGQTNRRLLIWSLLSLELWLSTFLA